MDKPLNSQFWLASFAVALLCRLDQRFGHGYGRVSHSTLCTVVPCVLSQLRPSTRAHVLDYWHSAEGCADVVSLSAQALAQDLAKEQLDHVFIIRTALRAAAPPKPAFNLGTNFAAIADAALNTTLSPAFSPYASDLAFLIAGFIFEDVGVTAYHVRRFLFAPPQARDAGRHTLCYRHTVRNR